MRVPVLLSLLTSLWLGGCAGRAVPAQGHSAEHHETPARSGHDHGPLVHRFEKAEEWEPRFESKERAAWQKPDYVVSLLDLRSGMSVADLGVGTGYFVSRLSQAVGSEGHVIGLDIEPDMIRYVSERAEREGLDNVVGRVCATDDPGLSEGEVDRILIVDTWHHIPERPAYARKLAAALRASGFVMVVDFNQTSEHGPPKAHRLLPEQVLAELSAAGLDAAVVPSDLSEQFVVVARRR